jgi:hypothetical protein
MMRSDPFALCLPRTRWATCACHPGAASRRGRWRLGRPVLAVVGGLTFALSACADARTPLDPGGEPPFHGTAATTSETGQQLARALALAMRDPGVRGLLRDAWRDSRFSEHKLVLHELAATREGQRLVAAAAASAGVDPSVVQGWILALPPLDFYVPVREHRRGWRGGRDVVVGLNLEVDDPRLTAYASDGSIVSLDRRDGVPARTVVILHPAEPKLVRVGGPAAGGDVIESPEEPSASIASECMTDPLGAGPVLEPEAFDAGTMEVGDPSCNVNIGGEYSGAVLDSYIGRVPDGWGDLEVMVKHYVVHADGTRTKVWRDPDFKYSGTSMEEIAYPRARAVMGNLIRVWEVDSGIPEVTGDDFWGETQPAGYGQWLPVYGLCMQVYADGDEEAACAGDLTRPVRTIDLLYLWVS